MQLPTTVNIFHVLCTFRLLGMPNYAKLWHRFRRRGVFVVRLFTVTQMKKLFFIMRIFQYIFARVPQTKKKQFCVMCKHFLLDFQVVTVLTFVVCRLSFQFARVALYLFRSL